jgi:hypothetical protein
MNALFGNKKNAGAANVGANAGANAANAGAANAANAGAANAANAGNAGANANAGNNGAAMMRRSRKQSGGAKAKKSRKVAKTRKASKAGKTPAVGSKAQVFHGSAKHTSGGLTKSDLMKHKGRIVSRKKHALGKKAFKNLVKAGYKPKKGTFKLFK